jgi:hypothetical protein
VRILLPFVGGGTTAASGQRPPLIFKTNAALQLRRSSHSRLAPQRNNAKPLRHERESYDGRTLKSTRTTWKDVKPKLLAFSSSQLLGLVQDLYRLNTENAAFIDARFLSNDTGQEHLAPYVSRTRAGLCPKQPWKQGVKLAEGRKAISEFKKANGNTRDFFTLMVYYVKCGNHFTFEFA